MRDRARVMVRENEIGIVGESKRGIGKQRERGRE